MTQTLHPLPVVRQRSETVGKPARRWSSAAVIAPVLTVAALLPNPGEAVRAETSRPASVGSMGERIAQENCGVCHAIAAGTRSPLPDAPTLPLLRATHDREAMARVIEEREQVIHPRMPSLRLDPDEVTEFLKYWDELKPAEARRP